MNDICVNSPQSRESDQYSDFEGSVDFRFDSMSNEPLFTTDAEHLFEIYINNLPVEAQQHYTCNTCRHFIERYGGLVTISPDGEMKPAIWGNNPPEFFRNSVEAMVDTILKSKVTGVFFSKDQVLGTPQTGEWTHLSVSLPKNRVFSNTLYGITQVIAEKKADFQILVSGLNEYPVEAVDVALNLLRSESLYRSEKVIGVAEWLKDLHTKLASTKNKKIKDNLMWLAVATAPPGYCHIKSTMIGTLLDDIVAGFGYEEVSRRFAKKMDGLEYQRPQVEPSTGNIERAEQIVKKLGIEKSLVRRFARIEELQLIWKPVEETKTDGEGVFSHLKPKDKKDFPQMEVHAITITWKKFSENVLPTTRSIEFLVDAGAENYTAIVTAQYDDAPPIVQWDSEEQRNPFSHYVYHNGSAPNSWNLKSGWVKVTGICYQPSMWYKENEHQGKSVNLILEGAKDLRYEHSGSALFPEILKSELREVRSTIEAYSRSAKLEGFNESSACGVRLQEGNTWDAVLRVTTELGVTKYKLDRWD